jgi:hypothetical protein
MTDERGIINQAIADQDVIHIVYRDYHGSVSQRDVTPLEWVDYHQFRAVCHLRGAERTFRVDRILECRPVSSRKSPPRPGATKSTSTPTDTNASPQPVSREIKRPLAREKTAKREKDRPSEHFTKVRNPDQWSQLVRYYAECLIRENQQQYVIEYTPDTCFFFPAPAQMVRGFLEGRTALQFNADQAGRPAPVSRFVSRVMERQGQRVCLGFPVYVVKAKQIAPVVFAPVEAEEFNGKLELRAQDPEPSYAVLKSAGFTDEEIADTLANLAATQTGDGVSRIEAWEMALVKQLEEISGEFLHRRPGDGIGSIPFVPGTLIEAPFLFSVQDHIATANLIQELQDLAAPCMWHAVPQSLKELLTSVSERDYPEPPLLEADGNIYVTEINDGQRQAISALAVEKVTVVTGPPGTGKSQMVLNVVAQAVLNNHSVLFASRNNEAVDVVMSRLRGEIRFPGAVRTGNRTNREKAARDMAAALDHISACDSQPSAASLHEEYSALKQQLSEAEETLHRVRELEALLESYQAEKENLIARLPKRVARDAQAYIPSYRPEEQEHLQATVSNLRTAALGLTNKTSRLEDEAHKLVEKNYLNHPLLDTLAQFEDQWGSFGGGFLHPRGFDTLESIRTYVQNWLDLLPALEAQRQIIRLNQHYHELSSRCLEQQAKLPAELQGQVASVVSSVERPHLVVLFKQSRRLMKYADAIVRGKVPFWDRLLTALGLKNPKQEIAQQFLSVQGPLGLAWILPESPPTLAFEEMAAAARHLTGFLYVCVLEKQMGETQDVLAIEKTRLDEATTPLPNVLREDVSKVQLPEMDLDLLRGPMQALLPRIETLIEHREQLAARVNSKLDANADALQTLDDYRSNQTDSDKRLWTLKTPTTLQAVTGHLTKWRNLVSLWGITAAIQHLEKQRNDLPTEVQAVKRVKELQNQQYKVSASLIRSHWIERVKALDTATIQQARYYVSAVEQLGEYDPVRYRELKSAEEGYFPAALQVFPIWATTNLSARTNLPLTPELFDVVVIDEASQCDVPSALPLLYRARRVMIIGDRNQLRHVATLHQDSDLDAAAKFGVAPSAFLYNTHSLFDVARRSVGNRPGDIMLKEHYRSDPQIIGFSKEVFYDNQIVIRTDLQRRGVPQDFISTGCGTFWVHVDGIAEHPAGGSAFNRAELEALQNLLPNLLQSLRRYESGGYHFNLGIVTPYREQANRISNWVSQKFGKDHGIQVGTAHTFQGNERDVMIFSSVLAPGLSEGSLNWLNRTDNLLNVAITRARLLMIVLGNWDYCHTLPSSNKYRQLADYIGIRLQRMVHQVNQLPLLGGEPFDIVGTRIDPAMGEHNRTTLRRLIASCHDFVWWIDPYFNNAIFDLFLDVFQDSEAKIRDVRLLTLLEQVQGSGDKKPQIDLEMATSVQNDFGKRGIRFELRFLKKQDTPHDRFLYSRGQAINMPPFAAAYGQHTRVSEYTRSKTDAAFFEEHWEKASSTLGDRY